jgi:2-phospho-L-lactate guanylyltransferase
MNRPSAGSWSAIIPLKPPGQRKTRLAGRLSPAQRDRLAEDMFHHVAAILRAVPSIAEIALLSESPLPGWAARWIHDHGRGLNVELSEAAKTYRTQNLLVIHADLPRLEVADIFDLTTARDTRSAIAPDRHGTGTNALAIRKEDSMSFAFGDHSFPRHLALAQRPLRVVKRIGLALDVDTPDDLDIAGRERFSPSLLAR